MHKSKLIALFKALQPTELKVVQKLVTHPINPIRKEVKVLFKFLKKYYPGYETTKINKQLVYKKLFPNTEFTDWKMRETMFQLANIIEEYWLSQSIQNNTVRRDFLLMEQYKSRRLNKQFFQTLKKVETGLLNRPTPEVNRARHLNHLYHLHFFHENYNRYTKGASQLIEKTAQSLDTYYLLQKMKYFIEIKTRKKISPVEISIFLEAEVLAAAKLAPFNKNEVVLCYLDIINLHDSFSDKLYRQLKNNLEDRYMNWGDEEKTFLYENLYNIIGFEVNQGRSDLLTEIVALYKLGLQRGWILYDNQIPEDQYHNMIHNACVIEDFEFAEELISKHSHFLDTSFKENALLLGQMQILFSRKNYSKTLQLYRELQFDMLVYKVRARKILIQTYYELHCLGEEVPLDMECSSYRTYIYRQTELLSKASIQTNLNFLKMVEKLYDYPYKEGRKQDLLEILDNLGGVSNKSWIRAKINAL